MKNKKITPWDIALVGLMVAVIEVCKALLGWLPNVELTSFWIIMFTLYFRWHIFYAIPVFILVEGAVYGFGLWWLQHLLVWPLLVLLVRFFCKNPDGFSLAMLSGIFGLGFGAVCAIPYLFIGWIGADFANGIRTAFAWWVAGIPWDLVHGIANFMIMLVLFSPVSHVLKRFSDLQNK